MLLLPAEDSAKNRERTETLLPHQLKELHLLSPAELELYKTLKSRFMVTYVYVHKKVFK